MLRGSGHGGCFRDDEDSVDVRPERQELKGMFQRQANLFRQVRQGAGRKARASHNRVVWEGALFILHG